MAWWEGWLEERSPCSTGACGNDHNTQADPDSVGESDMCRICFRGSQDGDLLSPCNCRGTIGLVHKECLEEWLSRRNTDECNICSYQFKVERTPKSIPDLLRDPSSQPNMRRIIVVLLESLKRAVQLLMIFWLTAAKIVSSISSEPGCILIGVTVVLAGGVYVSIIYLTERHHYQAFKQWRHKNAAVRLVLPNSLPEAAAPAGSNSSPPDQQQPSEHPRAPSSAPLAINSMTTSKDSATTMTTAAEQQAFQATEPGLPILPPTAMCMELHNYVVIGNPKEKTVGRQ